MRSQGTARELEKRRRLAVERVEQGWPQVEVAAFLGVHPVSVNAWMRAQRQGGAAALAAKPTPGRPRKLTARQEKAVLAWVAKLPTAFGYPDELWTSKRLAALIQERLGVTFNSNYLVEWLTRRKQSAQKPARKALEQDAAAVAKWLAEDWPRLQKKPATRKPTSCSLTRAASS